MLDRIIELIREQLHIAENVPITEETSFQQDLRADSFELMELIMAVEEEYGVKVEDDDLENLQTVGDVMDYIKDQGIDIE
ncbi:MAG: acyl carrier protein [Lachnospiraceae bacterium]|nr:acyl carrier protein [Lachnospiraceae bacterium]MCR4642959.1 acyl carrier protein [Lachnospiraceae bacterium]